MPERRATRFWIAVVSLSGIGSLAAVRFATPPAPDDKLTVVLLFFVVPGIVIWALGGIRRFIGVLAAIVFPFLWLVISKAPSDTLLLLFVPFLAGTVITLVARGARSTELSLKTPLAAVLAAAVTLLWPTPSRPEAATRVLLIGVDGATWDVIDPLVSAGKMPTFARLLEGCHRAKLRSLDSMFSPQVWTSIATGCPPKVHGVLSFASRSSDMRVGTLWDQMRVEGRSFGLCDWYFTWPPKPGTEGTDFVIPDVLAPDYRTYPPEYSFYRSLKEIEGLREKAGIRGRVSQYASAGLAGWRYGIRLSTLRRGFVELAARKLGRRNSLDAYWRARRLSIATEADLFAELMRIRRPEFAAVLFTDLDKVSHKYWKYMEPELFPEVSPADAARYGNVIRDLYVEIDRALAKILDSAPEEVDVMVVSDHGFRAVTREEAFEHRHVRILRLADEMGLTGKLIGANVGNYAYVYPMACPADERDKILNYAEPMLRNARYADTGRPFFVVKREDESLRLEISRGTDLKDDARVVLGDKEYPVGRLTSDPEKCDPGGHHPDGIYVMSGPSARLASGADSLHVLDVAPTIAALLDLPMCLRWPGRPALEGYPRVDTRVAEYARPYRPETPPTEIDDAMMEKLRAIGYLE